MPKNTHLIYIEDRSLYDGWCATLNTKTKEIVWREAWFTEKLTPEFKKEWEEKTKKEFEDYGELDTPKDETTI